MSLKSQENERIVLDLEGKFSKKKLRTKTSSLKLRHPRVPKQLPKTLFCYGFKKKPYSLDLRFKSLKLDLLIKQRCKHFYFFLFQISITTVCCCCCCFDFELPYDGGWADLDSSIDYVILEIFYIDVSRVLMSQYLVFLI